MGDLEWRRSTEILRRVKHGQGEASFHVGLLRLSWAVAIDSTLSSNRPPDIRPGRIPGRSNKEPIGAGQMGFAFLAAVADAYPTVSAYWSDSRLAAAAPFKSAVIFVVLTWMTGTGAVE